MLCRFCFSHRNFGCFDLVCLIVPSTFVIFPIGITVICNIICLWMGNLYAATPGQNPGVARIYIYTLDIHLGILLRRRCTLSVYSRMDWGVDWRYGVRNDVPLSLALHKAILRPGDRVLESDAQGFGGVGENWELQIQKPIFDWRLCSHAGLRTNFATFQGLKFIVLLHFVMCLCD